MIATFALNVCLYVHPLQGNVKHKRTKVRIKSFTWSVYTWPLPYMR